NSHSLLSVRTPLRTPMLPLSPQEYQGLVASGALPVRQALQTHIATSGDKPPETKEEARAALEVMFQIRADKIRRAIEEGKLATAEALQHRVIKRRESIKTQYQQHPQRDRSRSAPSERVILAALTQSAAAAATTIAAPPQSLMSGVVSQQPWFPSSTQIHPHHHPSTGPIIHQEPISMHSHGNTTSYTGLTNTTNTTNNAAGATVLVPGATAGDPMVIEGEDQQDTTFGLSDDDLMSSFTIFTAKLGDSLLVRDVSRIGGMAVQGAAPLGYNNSIFTGSNIHVSQQDNNNRMTVAAATEAAVQELPLEMMMVDTALPTLSPTASSESQSPSPWIPWHGAGAPVGGSYEKDLVANSLQGTVGPMTVHPFAQAQHPVAATLFPPQPPPPAGEQPHAPMSSLVMPQQQQVYSSLLPKDPRDQVPPQHYPSPSFVFGSNIQSVQIHPQGCFGTDVHAEGAGAGAGARSQVGEKQVGAWNQYVQYLLHQQEFADHRHNQQGPPFIPPQHGQHLQQQQPQHQVQQDPFPQQQPSDADMSLASPPPPQNATMDPHWQATMMTMMMDQNPTREAIHGLGQQPGFYMATTGAAVGDGQRMTSSSTFPPTDAYLAL
ncbi:hypothetical protein BGZ96_002650, partial [Linnemannia gamsii]